MDLSEKDLPKGLSFIKDELVAKNHKFETRVATFAFKDKQQELHYVSTPNGGAMIVVLNNDGKILLQRQFRPIVNYLSIEFPAGAVEPGEDPLEAAKRELMEETGVEAAQWESFGGFHVSPGSTTSNGWVFLAHTIVEGQAKPDIFEFLEHFWETPENIEKMIHDGTIKDGWVLCSWLLTKDRVLAIIDQMKEGG